MLKGMNKRTLYSLTVTYRNDCKMKEYNTFARNPTKRKKKSKGSIGGVKLSGVRYSTIGKKSRGRRGGRRIAS